MKSVTSRRFREMFANLPAQPCSQARRAYTLNIYFVRIGLGYRALGQMKGSDIIWFWIGSHGEYNKLI